MKKLLSLAVFCLTAIFTVSLISCTAQAPKANLKTEIDSLSYAYGVLYTQGLDQHLMSKGVDEAEKGEFYKGFMEGMKIKKGDKKANAYLVGQEIGKLVAADMFSGINEDMFGPDSTATESLKQSQFIAGFLAAAMNKTTPLIKKEDAELFVQTKKEEVFAKANEKLKIENQAFLDENKKKDGVVTSPSGLQYKVNSEGAGAKPTAEDMVKVKYKGTTINGKEFDSNDEATFSLSHVIVGWTEGIQLMPVGSKYTFYIPYDLAYGAKGKRPSIEPYATLIFDVELLEIVKK